LRKISEEPIAAIRMAASVEPTTVPVPPRIETPPTTEAVMMPSPLRSRCHPGSAVRRCPGPMNTAPGREHTAAAIPLSEPVFMGPGLGLRPNRDDNGDVVVIVRSSAP
jgi:hypothetical protein